MTEEKPFHAVNHDKLVAFFQAGAKTSENLGFELEHILLHAKTHESVSYFEPGGVRDVLERLAPFYDETVYEGEHIIGLSRLRTVVSIEPAGQLEVSLGPHASVEGIERDYLAFRNELDPILEEFGLETPMLGYSPSAKADELSLVPKYRYDCMTKFLGAQSHAGICMMRGTGSLQVSVDYASEADALRKLRIAEILAPILSLMCDNSPIFEGEECEGSLVRTRIWDSMCQDRVGTVEGSLSSDFTFDDYADYILSRQAILVPTGEGHGEWRYVGEQTFDEIYAEREMTDFEVQHALSMVWPDARLKNFVEIRPADAMPLEYSLAYVVLLRALFYNTRNLEVLESLLSQVGEQEVREAKHALAERGYGAEVYGRSAEFWADLLLVLAEGSLLPGEGEYLEPLASMVKYRFTLAGIWPRLMEKRNRMPEASPTAPIIGVVPRYDFEWTGLAVSDGYLSGLLETGAVPVVLPPTTDPARISRLVDVCDGFLIPGGQDIDPACYGARRAPRTHRSATTRDAMEQVLVKAAVAADKPLLGICRGMQAINVAFGGTLKQDILDARPDAVSDTSAAASGRARIDHVQRRPFDMPTHMVDIVEGTLLECCVGAPHLGVNTIHHQCVDELGEGLVANAYSPEDGIIEGIEMPGRRFVVGVQWHPEHMWRLRPHSKRLFRAFVEAAVAARG